MNLKNSWTYLEILVVKVKSHDGCALHKIQLKGVVQKLSKKGNKIFLGERPQHIVCYLRISSWRYKHILDVGECQASDPLLMSFEFSLNLYKRVKLTLLIRSHLFTTQMISWQYIRNKLRTSSTRTLYIWMDESSMPIAIILLSWGWKAKNVAAGGGGMNVVIVCIIDIKRKAYWSHADHIYKPKDLHYIRKGAQFTHETKRSKPNYILFWISLKIIIRKGKMLAHYRNISESIDQMRD